MGWLLRINTYMNKYLQILLGVGLTIWFLNVLWIAYMATKNYTHFPITREEVTTDNPNKVYHPGDRMVVFYKSRETETCDIFYTRIMRSFDTNHEFVIDSGDFTTTGDNVIRNVPRVLYIPPSIPPGDYELVTDYRTDCNFFDNIFPREWSEAEIRFTVVPNNTNENASDKNNK